MEKFLFDQTEYGTEYFIWDDDDDTFHIQTEMDCSYLLEWNKAQFNDAGPGFGDMKKVGSIPPNLYYKLKAEGVFDDQKRFKAWMNDPDNRFFRTFPGVI